MLQTSAKHSRPSHGQAVLPDNSSIPKKSKDGAPSPFWGGSKSDMVPILKTTAEEFNKHTLC
jgi:hypothetical protein